jgi:holliday junction DNA helicase RuvA
MIAALRGVVLEKNLNDAVLDVNGTGYRVFFSLLTLSRLPDEGQAVHVRVRTVVRDDAFDLYGFLSQIEEQMFLLLTSVSHVGPKLALTVLSGLEIEELAKAIGRGEVNRLTQIHGVGRKTAERLVLELREKAKALVLEAKAEEAVRPAAGAKSDLISALVNLGYKPAQAESAADLATAAAGVDAPFELLFREALKRLRTVSA